MLCTVLYVVYCVICCVLCYMLCTVLYVVYCVICCVPCYPFCTAFCIDHFRWSAVTQAHFPASMQHCYSAVASSYNAAEHKRILITRTDEELRKWRSKWITFIYNESYVLHACINVSYACTDLVMMYHSMLASG